MPSGVWYPVGADSAPGVPRVDAFGLKGDLSVGVSHQVDGSLLVSAVDPASCDSVVPECEGVGVVIGVVYSGADDDVPWVQGLDPERG